MESKNQPTLNIFKFRCNCLPDFPAYDDLVSKYYKFFNRKNGLNDLQNDYKEKKLKNLTEIFTPDQTLSYLEEVNDDWIRRKQEEDKQRRKQNNITITCVCGVPVKKECYNNHLKTQKHKNLVLGIPSKTKKDYDHTYYERHKCMVHCDICDYDVLNYNVEEHNNTNIHKENKIKMQIEDFRMTGICPFCKCEVKCIALHEKTQKHQMNLIKN